MDIKASKKFEFWGEFERIEFASDSVVLAKGIESCLYLTAKQSFANVIQDCLANGLPFLQKFVRHLVHKEVFAMAAS